MGAIDGDCSAGIRMEDENKLREWERLVFDVHTFCHYCDDFITSSDSIVLSRIEVRSGHVVAVQGRCYYLFTYSHRQYDIALLDSVCIYI